MESYNLLDKNLVEKLSKEELLNEYLNLRQNFDSQNEKLDKCQQELYSTNQSYNVAQKTNIEIETENESLIAENKELNKKIKSLENQIINIKREHELEINRYQQIFENQQAELEKYKKKEEKTQIDPSVTKKIQDLETENNNLGKELIETKYQCEQYVEKVGDLNLEIERSHLKNQQLENQWHKLNEEYDELKHVLECKDEQLSSIKINEESLQEEVATLRTELNLLKCDSANHAAKGNSLFGEVYDSRKQLQNKLAQMKQLYLDMRSKYSYKVHENLKLTNENVLLSKYLEKEVVYQHNTEYSWKLAHENTIRELKENNDSLQNEIKRYNCSLNPKTGNDEIKWLKNCVNDLFERNKQIVIECQEKLNKKLFNDLALNQCLNEAKRDVSNWKSRTMTAETKIQELQLEIESLKIDKSAVKDESDVIVISDESDSSISENKENFNSTSFLSSTCSGFQNLNVSEGDSFKINNESVELKENQTNATNTENIQKQVEPSANTDKSPQVLKPRRVFPVKTRYVKSRKPEKKVNKSE